MLLQKTLFGRFGSLVDLFNAGKRMLSKIVKIWNNLMKWSLKKLGLPLEIPAFPLACKQCSCLANLESVLDSHFGSSSCLASIVPNQPKREFDHDSWIRCMEAQMKAIRTRQCQMSKHPTYCYMDSTLAFE